ncbi:MAG TPA: DUF5996 family protein [Terracidiphilus sp.]
MNSTHCTDEPSCWPALPLASWQETYATLHMWTQIIGKIRMSLTPLVNHWWNVPLYVTSRGLTTTCIPYGERAFELWFDFLGHKLMLETNDGAVKSVPLEAKCVAEFYAQCMAMLKSVDISPKIWPVPVEIPNPIRFEKDQAHCSYDPESVSTFWRILLSIDAVLQIFRARFIGKSSPVHFFWGSFDLAVTRFSGRKAPERPGADSITREAYSHEASSVGFWPGGGGISGPAFYSYMAPEPQGYRDSRVLPPNSRYDTSLNEFILMYEDVRTAASPSSALLDFCQSTYEGGANLAGWDRPSLER